MFENLRVVSLSATANYQDTLGSMLNPMNIIAGIKKARNPPVHDILFGFNRGRCEVWRNASYVFRHVFTES